MPQIPALTRDKFVCSECADARFLRSACDRHNTRTTDERKLDPVTLTPNISTKLCAEREIEIPHLGIDQNTLPQQAFIDA